MPYAPKVSFDAVPFIVRYEDEAGLITFAFDIADPVGPVFSLEHRQRVTGSRARYEAAFASCVSFLQGRGKNVAVHGRPFFLAEVDPGEVRAKVALDVSALPADLVAWARSNGSFIGPDRLELRPPASPEDWDLWPVFQRSKPALQVVYEPSTRQYGIVERGAFHGFWGSLGQTLSAVRDA